VGTLGTVKSDEKEPRNKLPLAKGRFEFKDEDHNDACVYMTSGGPAGRLVCGLTEVLCNYDHEYTEMRMDHCKDGIIRQSTIVCELSDSIQLKKRAPAEATTITTATPTANIAKRAPAETIPPVVVDRRGAPPSSVLTLDPMKTPGSMIPVPTEKPNKA
jgi:hypothetical protein